MLRKVVKAVAVSGGRQRDIVLPGAVLSPSECTFGFDPNVVVARNYKLHNPEAPECLECNVPTGERVGNVPRQDESVWGKPFYLFHEIRKELTIMSRDVDMQIRREGNSHQTVLCTPLRNQQLSPNLARSCCCATSLDDLLRTHPLLQKEAERLSHQ